MSKTYYKLAIIVSATAAIFFALGYWTGISHYNKLQKLYDATVEECAEAWLAYPVKGEWKK